MPLYEYRCRACGTKFELIQKFSDPPLETCRECSGPVEKLISQSAFLLKGSGWYVTDYARKAAPAGDGNGGKAGSGKDAGGSEATGDKTGGKGESPGKADSQGSAAATAKESTASTAASGAAPAKTSA